MVCRLSKERTLLQHNVNKLIRSIQHPRASSVSVQHHEFIAKAISLRQKERTTAYGVQLSFVLHIVADNNTDDDTNDCADNEDDDEANPAHATCATCMYDSLFSLLQPIRAVAHSQDRHQNIQASTYPCSVLYSTSWAVCWMASMASSCWLTSTLIYVLLARNVGMHL